MSRATAPELPEQLNLADLFLRARLREGAGERIALRLDERSWTYAEVAALADDFTRALRHRGVRREERVLLALPDSAEMVGALFGILQLGAVVVMLNPGLGQAEIAAQVDYTRARLAVVHAECEPSFRAAAEASPWLESGLLVVDPERPEDRNESHDDSFQAALEASRANGAPEVPVEIAPTHRDEAAIWLFSGGTTGRPKAVVQTHGAFANTTELYGRRTLGYGPDDITLSVPKLYFGYATGSNLFFPFSVGGSAVLFAEKPTPEVLFEKIARHRPTILINVPTLVHRMIEAATLDPGKETAPDPAVDLSSLRFATSAGEALPSALYERWRDTFGVELLDGLGTAEMWHVFVTNRPGEVRPGTLGRVVEGFEIEARDPDGQRLPSGQIGRLWVRGRSRALGYWQNQAQSEEAFRGEWFAAGDLISIDDDGFVTYCGRGGDAMKVAGRWLLPREVEECLLRHPAVQECAVIGACDAHGLTKPHAFVVAQPGAHDPAAPSDWRNELAETLKAWCLDHLEAYKHPRRVHLLDDFPRTHLGKVDRGELQRRAGASPDL